MFVCSEELSRRDLAILSLQRDVNFLKEVRYLPMMKNTSPAEHPHLLGPSEAMKRHLMGLSWTPGSMRDPAYAQAGAAAPPPTTTMHGHNPERLVISGAPPNQAEPRPSSPQ